MESKRKMEVKLFADPLCWKFREEHPEEFDSFGCGPGGIGDWLVPDTLYGLSIRESCCCHDWGYFIGETQEDKVETDDIFLNNMIRQITDGTKSSWLLKPRLRRAKLYYIMVRDFGGPAFWDDKNKDSEFREYNGGTKTTVVGI